MRLHAAPLIAAALALSGGAIAQSRTSVEQLERGSSAPHEASQVGPASPGPLPQLSTHDCAPAARQLSGAADGRAPPSQISAPGAGAPATDQLAKGRRTADAPAPLSTPAQGRNATVETLRGDDRCDPQNLPRLAAGERARCAQVIERRSAEFARPTVPEPSPEERLLRGQQAAGSADARTAARRLGEGEVDDSLAAQAIASATNRPAGDERGTDPRPNDPALSPEAQALINAIVQGAGASVTVR